MKSIFTQAFKEFTKRNFVKIQELFKGDKHEVDVYPWDLCVIRKDLLMGIPGFCSPNKDKEPVIIICSKITSQ